MSAGIKVAAVGWEHPGWCDRFYPDDLPPEWRLTYYGNEFRQVLVPADRWQRGEAPWIQWQEDVDPSFRFIFEVSDLAASSAAGLKRIGAAAGVLREQLAGAVAWQPLPDDQAAALRRVLGRQRFLALAGPEVEEGYRLAAGDGVLCARVESARAVDLPWLRGLMERLQRRAGGEAGRWLFIQGAPPDIKVLRDAELLQQLLVGGSAGRG